MNSPLKINIDHFRDELRVCNYEADNYEFPKAGYRLREAAARGNVRCFASQNRYHVAARGRTNTAARELGACRAKSERFFVPRQMDFS
jgi:hypothetical protein